MRLYVLALNPTDSVTEGFLPAAARLGLDVTLLTAPEYTEAHRKTADGLEILECDVRDFREVIGRISRHRAPDAVFSNSDHLQTQAALTAGYFGLPGKDWKTALRAKNKAEMRRRLAATGADTVWSAELTPDRDPAGLVATGGPIPYPCVIKPREGVASEDVVLAGNATELLGRCQDIRARRPETALVIEEFLPGQLHTLETLGDGAVRQVLGGFRTTLSPPPYFIEERMDFDPDPPQVVTAQVLAQLDALGVGFGVCHTEFVVHAGRARIVEVNYRAAGDQCDLLMAGLLGIPLFELILRVHLGEPLPADLHARRDGRARIEYLCADRAGTLTAAPGPCDTEAEGGVRLAYRPWRAVGERHELHHTNRDYLGVLRATGTDQPAVERAAARFLAANRWEIAP
ncbi:siderophore biosynthesis protein [Actinacidiphila oryziradicis]|uniref:siderophore biosynthesis protein n=1 Tax=Actinacidiphila oryziradicis TaxID=2571141 RepID=UPI0023F054B3|nr:siderophore biosynthesis protein [Actinacidiphila oryziradicis]MCW2875586.1 avsA [Actinacidiphila oryziradicis]